MKRIFISFLCGALIMCLASCSNIPDEPATTGTKKYSYKNLYGETAPVAENINDFPDISQPLKYIETTHYLDFSLRSYYVYGNTVATIDSVEIHDISTPQAHLYATVKLKMIAKGREDTMKIAYKAYDANGNLLKLFSIEANIDGKKDNSPFATAITLPKNTAKVEFLDYNIE